MTTEREFHRSPTSQLLRHIDDDAAPNRMTKSSRLDAPAHPEPSGLVMRKAARDGNGVADGAEDLVSSAAASCGSALPATLMRKFESSLDADLSSVRIHTGSSSAAAAHAVGARAYTIGQDIHFGASQYDPSSAAGEHLLAHEVAHTVQQHGGSPRRQNKLEVSSPHDVAEHEADRAADAMVAGRSAVVSSGQGIARKTAPSAEDTARIKAAEKAFDAAVNDATQKFGLIATQQAFIAQQVKEAALATDPPSLGLTVIATLVGAAIGAAAGPLGSVIASSVANVLTQKIAQDFARKAVAAAVVKGGAAASGVAQQQIKKVKSQSQTLEAYLNLMQLTFPALAGRQQTAFREQMKACWNSAKNDPTAAEEAQQQAEAARDGLQAGLEGLTFATETQNAAFSALCSILSHGDEEHGVLKLELMVTNKGGLGPGMFESAMINGITNKLGGIMTGRPLSSFRKMPIQINAYYFTDRPRIGDQGDSDVPQTHQFTVNVSEAGQATTAQPSEPWLLERGGGNANAGAKSLYTALLGVPVVLQDS